MDARPPPDVLAAFGLAGAPVLLSGGQGTSWRVGAAVLKPLDLPPSALSWLAGLLTTLDGRPDFRVSPPRAAVDGRLEVGGWTAWRYEPGRHVGGRWSDIIAAGRRFHAALRAEPEPAFLRRRTDVWAVADRVAWGELPATEPATTTGIADLMTACRPVAAASQLVHGDLTGNVLFDDELPPLIIDPSLYWRPPQYASAIVVADALLFEGADETVVEPLLHEKRDFAQYLLRALVFRAVTDQLAGGGDAGAADRYRPVIELALSLA